jgi:hypothetical protein
MSMEESEKPFVLLECSLLRQATGLNCTNLRELLEAIRTVPDAVLDYHMMRCALEDHFELYEFPNDLARWCWDALGDHVLAEQLGLSTHININQRPICEPPWSMRSKGSSGSYSGSPGRGRVWS